MFMCNRPTLFASAALVCLTSLAPLARATHVEPIQASISCPTSPCYQPNAWVSATVTASDWDLCSDGTQQWQPDTLTYSWSGGLDGYTSSDHRTYHCKVPDNRGGSFVIQCVVDDAPGCINDQPVTKQCTVHICECSADSDCPECYECDPQTYDCVAVPECTERVQVRLWVTTAAPNTSAGGNIVFESGYGPTTPFAIGENRYGSYDVHTSASVGTPKFTAADIPDVVEPRNLDPGTRVYVWAAFCGRGDVAPIKPLLGWEKAAWKVECLHLRLVTTGTLTVNPTWYEYQEDEARRWFVDSDMSGGDVVFASAFDTGWGWVAGTGGLVAADRMQTAACDDDGYGGDGHYYAGAMLLGTIGHVSGNGELFIGLGYKGIFSSNGTVEFFSGTEQDAIEADLYDKLQPPRVGQTPEVTW